MSIFTDVEITYPLTALKYEPVRLGTLVTFKVSDEPLEQWAHEYRRNGYVVVIDYRFWEFETQNNKDKHRVRCRFTNPDIATLCKLTWGGAV